VRAADAGAISAVVRTVVRMLGARETQQLQPQPRELRLALVRVL
jgi:hypothetical protein